MRKMKLLAEELSEIWLLNKNSRELEPAQKIFTFNGRERFLLPFTLRVTGIKTVIK